MQDQPDPIDGAFESLRGRQWPGDYQNRQLREKLMQEVRTRQSSSRLRRRGTLVATLALLVLGSAGFAAAGGVELVKSWFVTIEVRINGEVVDVVETEAVIEIDGGQMTITLEDMELETEVDGPVTAEVTVIAVEEDSEDDE